MIFLYYIGSIQLSDELYKRKLKLSKTTFQVAIMKLNDYRVNFIRKIEADKDDVSGRLY